MYLLLLTSGTNLTKFTVDGLALLFVSQCAFLSAFPSLVLVLCFCISVLLSPISLGTLSSPPFITPSNSSPSPSSGFSPFSLLKLFSSPSTWEASSSTSSGTSSSGFLSWGRFQAFSSPSFQEDWLVRGSFGSQPFACSVFLSPRRLFPRQSFVFLLHCLGGLINLKSLILLPISTSGFSF